MSGTHKKLAVIRTAHKRKIAHTVAKRLRALGHAVQYVSAVDLYGARLTFYDLRIDGVLIAVRQSHSKPLPGDAVYYGHDPMMYVQRGASDVGKLLEHIARVNRVSHAVHWAIPSA